MIESEADIKRTVSDFLQIEQNFGKLVFLRLNAGQFPTQSGRWAMGCPKGTADLLVLREDIIPAYPTHVAVKAPQVIFIELKSAKGKQSKDQKAFEEQVKAQGCAYHLARSLNDVMEILGYDTEA